MKSDYRADGGGALTDHGPDGASAESGPDARGTDRSAERDSPTRTSSRTESRGPVRLFYPAPGLVEAALGYGLLYLIVDAVTPVLVDELAGTAPDLVPEPFTTLMAFVLWVALGATVLGVVLAQVRDNPREFATPAEREEFLASNRPTASDYLFAGALAVLGSALAALAWDAFLPALEDVLVVIVEADGTVPPSLNVGDAAVFVAFFVGFAAFARGVDRLAAGGVRELLYRRSRRLRHSRTEE